MSVKLDAELAGEILFSSTGDEIFEEYKIIDGGHWYGSGKYQTKKVVFSHGDKLFRLTAYRTGSYYSDYHTDFELDCPEVFRKERIITEVYYE